MKAEGDTINKNIADLVEKELPVRVQQSLDVVRVIGNESVHLGVMDLKDDFETGKILFNLVNSITTEIISNPKQLHELYGNLPEGKLKGIEQRDAKAKGK